MADSSRRRDTKAHQTLRALTETTLDDGNFVLDLSGQAAPEKQPTVFDVVRRSLAYSESEFHARFPHPFLIRIGKSDPNQVYQPLDKTSQGLQSAPGIESEFMRCSIFEVKPREAGKKSSTKVTVGRSRSNDVVLKYSCISKHHVRFEQHANKEWHLVDTESLNGTFLDSFRLVPNRPYLLNSGREIDLSKHFSFFFVSANEMYEYIQNVRPANEEGLA